MKNNFQKHSIELQRSLVGFDFTKLNCISSNSYWEIKPLALEVSEDSLGTNKYLFAELTDTVSSSKFAIFVTYYSDPNDKVPHTPEMCYTQAGAILLSNEISTLDQHGIHIPFNIIKFDMPNTDIDRLVLYNFCVEGQFCTSRNKVRVITGMPGNKYTYFSKIEIAIDIKDKTDTNLKQCKSVLGDMIYILQEYYFPSSNSLKK